MAFDEDLSAFFDVDEFAVLASWRSSLPTASAIEAAVQLDAPGQVLLDGVQTTDWSVLYRVDVWPTVRSGDRITQGSRTFEVSEILAVGDGALSRAALRRLDR